MKDAMHSRVPVVVASRGRAPKARRHLHYCSVCMRRIWFDPIVMREPEGVPEPRLSWVLCKECQGMLLTEMRRSPVLSPLRLRIAMGLVAAERSPYAYATPIVEGQRDQKRIVGIAALIFIAMLLHLVLIVWIASWGVR